MLWAYGEKERLGFGHVPASDRTEFECFVAQGAEDMRLDRYLALRFKYFSRERWKEEVGRGQILVNGRAEKPTYHLKHNDHIRFGGSGLSEPAVPLTIKILYEDDAVVAFEKPAHIPVHHGGKYLKNTFLQLVHWKQQELGISKKIRFLHRLDMETSGVILATKDGVGHSELYRQFEQDEVSKSYLAVVFGLPQKEFWTVDAPIGAPEKSQIRIKLWSNPAGLPSRTDFFRIASSVETNVSLVLARPKTGRTNQIRIHAAVSGHPLVGDKTYFPDESIFIHHQKHGYDKFVHDHVKFHRCLLHAWKIQFKHPISEKLVVAQAPLPEDFKFCLRAFGLNVTEATEKLARGEELHTPAPA